jgi:hypothetical protein
MITALLISFVIASLSVIFGWLPLVDTLPFGIDAAFTTGFSAWNAFLEFMWPLQVVWQAMIFYYGFLALLMMLKFFLGSRIPH